MNAKMQTFIGTKIINACQMTRGDYNKLRGWDVPADENPEDAGYLVEYIDGGAANVPGFDGYVSWSPTGVFERAYRPVSAMTFGDAIVMLKQGRKVARAGWNGKGMWLVLIRAGNAMSHGFDMQDCIGMKTATNVMQPGWLASQNDVLAEDWTVVD